MYAFGMGLLRGEREFWILFFWIGGVVGWADIYFQKSFVRKIAAFTIIKEPGKTKYDWQETILAFLDRMTSMGRRATIPDDVLVAIALNLLPEEVGKKILMNAQRGITWTFLYQAYSSIGVGKTFELPIEALKERTFEKRKIIKCWAL